MTTNWTRWSVALLLACATAAHAQDQDGDGSDDWIEAAAQSPDGDFGDGNGDGIADATQADVATARLATGVRGRENDYTTWAPRAAGSGAGFRYEGAAGLSEADVTDLAGARVTLPFGAVHAVLVNWPALIKSDGTIYDTFAVSVRYPFESFDADWSWYDAAPALGLEDGAEVVSARPVGDTWQLRIRVGTGSGRAPLRLVGGPTPN